VKDDENFLKIFLKKVTTFSNQELSEERSMKTSWSTFDNKFRATGNILKVKHILYRWILEA